jgi:hypothetical protein
MLWRLAGIAVVAGLLGPTQTRAATVDYDFTIGDTAAGTVVTGEIDGLTVGGTNITPSAVFITGYTSTIVTSFSAFVFPVPLPINNFSSDLFSLDATGALIAANLQGTGAYVTNCTGVSCLVDLVLSGTLSLGFNGGVFQDVTPASGPIVQNGGDLGTAFNQAATTTTPLPAALPLFGTGLGALGLFGWRRKRKNAAAPVAA